MATNKFYELVQSGNVADLTIYGDITSLPWFASDMSSHKLRSDIEALENVSHINVHINSYGGEVAEGLAIYNTLKNHPAEVTTICDGFACSIASVIFMAGDKRCMNEASLLMIHNAWMCTAGNAEEMRKAADDLEIITEQSKTIYLASSNLSRETLDELMDNESWIGSSDAVEYGFATEIIPIEKNKNASQSARESIMSAVLGPKPQPNAETTPNAEPALEGIAPEEPDNTPSNSWKNYFN